jgi:hypothetical protein
MAEQQKGRKLVLWLVIVGLVAFFGIRFIACKSDDKQAGPEEKQLALTISKNTEAFNQSFEKLLNGYLALENALTDYDTAKANSSAKELVALSDSLKTGEIKGDTSGAIKATAENYTGTISGSCKGLMGETDLVKKKKEFQVISDALYDLIRTVKYDRQKIYHQHCPMAFNDEEEAYWISNSNEVVNPYLGRKHPKYKESMLHCGDITDSLDFSKK